MAKVGVLEAMPSFTVSELKKELHRLVKAILDEEDYSLELIDEATKILTAFKELKYSIVPNDFKCPISGKLMSDPVVLSSGQTFDRSSIQEHGFDETIIISNVLVREMISRWCRQRGIEPPNLAADADEDVDVHADKSFLNSLIEKLSSSSLSNQIEAARRLRMLTKNNPKFRVIFSKFPDTISKLVSSLVLSDPTPDPTLQENLIATIFNISILEDNKVLLARCPHVIPVLIDSLKFGSMEARSNAAATLFTLSAVDSLRLSIGKSGAFKPLIDLLEEGNQGAILDAASAIYNLCIARENRGIAVHEGAVRIMFKKILDGILVDELTTIISMLANYPQAVAEMVELNAVYHLLSRIRDNEENSARNKEHYAAILYAICLNDHTKLSEIREDENANQTLSKLAKHGSSRAKRKAEGILHWIEKGASLAHNTA